MVNRAKNKGTTAETAVVKALRGVGVAAERVALAGALDRGDIWIAGGRGVVEVKAYAAAPSWQQLDAWWVEAVTEAARVSPDAVPFLVVKRPGSGQVADWWVYRADGAGRRVQVRGSDWLDEMAARYSDEGADG